jgi:molybdopterin converting factor small subunit
MKQPTNAPATTAPSAVTIRVPAPLRALAGGHGEVMVPGATVGAALDGLLARHPGLRRHLRDEAGALREHVNVFLNEEDVRHLDGEPTALGEGDVITVVASIAGG